MENKENLDLIWKRHLGYYGILENKGSLTVKSGFGLHHLVLVRAAGPLMESEADGSLGAIGILGWLGGGLI
jgi:hypothetical protein